MGNFVLKFRLKRLDPLQSVSKSPTQPNGNSHENIHQLDAKTAPACSRRIRCHHHIDPHIAGAIAEHANVASKWVGDSWS
jgi:hypothetical protein